MGHFWDGKPRLHIRYSVGDLIKFSGSEDPSDNIFADDYAVVTKIDPWFMGKKAGMQTEAYAIEIIWQYNMEWGRHDIDAGMDPFEIVAKGKTHV
jgi:hypothetical protein